MYIAMEERKPIKVQNSKLSTTNHIIELLVNLDQNPNTKSIASNTIIMANPALTPKEQVDGNIKAKNKSITAHEAKAIKR